MSLYCDHVMSNGYASFRFSIKQWANVADTLLTGQSTKSTTALFTGSFAVIDEDGNVVS